MKSIIFALAAIISPMFVACGSNEKVEETTVDSVVVDTVEVVDTISVDSIM